MPFSDDYAILSGTNFNCNATASWQTTGSVPTVALAPTTDNVEGTNAIAITADGAGVAVIFNDTISGLDLRVDDVHFWFKYAKGKSPPYLTSTNTAVRVRLHVGSVGNYYEYWLTDFGDEELVNGFQVFQFGGSNADATGGTPNIANSVVRVELRLDFANANNGGDDNPLIMDAWFGGTTVTITGTETLASLQNYGDNTRSGFPIGINKVSGGFANIRSGLTISGSLSVLNTFILFNQFSNEVKHALTINNGGSFVMGEQSNGNPVRGCQLVLPAGRLSDIVVNNGGTFRAFGSKIFRFRDLFFGAASDTSSVVELRAVDIGSCETAYFRASTLDVEDVQVHDNDNNNRDWAAEFSVSPTSCKNLLLYSNVVAARFTATLSIESLLAQDNTSDFQIAEGATVTLTNSVYDDTALTRV